MRKLTNKMVLHKKHHPVLLQQNVSVFKNSQCLGFSRYQFENKHKLNSNYSKQILKFSSKSFKEFPRKLTDNAKTVIQTSFSHVPDHFRKFELILPQNSEWAAAYTCLSCLVRFPWHGCHWPVDRLPRGGRSCTPALPPDSRIFIITSALAAYKVRPCIWKVRAPRPQTQQTVAPLISRVGQPGSVHVNTAITLTRNLAAPIFGAVYKLCGLAERCMCSFIFTFVWFVPGKLSIWL